MKFHELLNHADTATLHFGPLALMTTTHMERTIKDTKKDMERTNLKPTQTTQTVIFFCFHKLACNVFVHEQLARRQTIRLAARRMFPALYKSIDDDVQKGEKNFEKVNTMMGAFLEPALLSVQSAGNLCSLPFLAQLLDVPSTRTVKLGSKGYHLCRPYYSRSLDRSHLAGQPVPPIKKGVCVIWAHRASKSGSDVMLFSEAGEQIIVRVCCILQIDGVGDVLVVGQRYKELSDPEAAQQGCKGETLCEVCSLYSRISLTFALLPADNVSSFLVFKLAELEHPNVQMSNLWHHDGDLYWNNSLIHPQMHNDPLTLGNSFKSFGKDSEE